MKLIIHDSISFGTMIRITDIDDFQWGRIKSSAHLHHFSTDLILKQEVTAKSSRQNGIENFYG